MAIRRITALVALLACASAVLLLAGAAAGSSPTKSSPTKQRVSFLQTFNPQTGEGAWELIPLSVGPLKRDSGSQSGGGSVGAIRLSNGQRVTPITGSDKMTGKRGTLVIAQRLVSTGVGGHYTADIGTWRFVRGTGAYSNIRGGGRFAGVGVPGGMVIINQEGYLTTG